MHVDDMGPVEAGDLTSAREAIWQPSKRDGVVMRGRLMVHRVRRLGCGGRWFVSDNRSSFVPDNAAILLPLRGR